MSTQLDIDDVCAGNPLAEQELADMRERIKDLEIALSGVSAWAEKVPFNCVHPPECTFCNWCGFKMKRVSKIIGECYYAPTKRRRYFSLDAACRGEARAIIAKRYPTEPFERDTGHSFHWRDKERSEVLYRRLTRLIKSEANKKGLE